MEPTEEDLIEWYRLLALPEDEFRRETRAYFDSTIEMDAYIEEAQRDLTTPPPVRYKGRHRA